MAVTTATEVSATTSTSTAHTFTVDAGSSLTYTAFSLSNERILIERYDGSGYAPLTLDGKEVVITAQNNLVKINGPFAGRINKPATKNSVSVVSYT